MSEPLHHQKKPCDNCPWRRDAPPGEFPVERWKALEDTSGSRGQEVWLDAPVFACHKIREGAEVACAGWLAVVGYEHLGIRLAVLQHRLSASALAPGLDWPPLYDSYAEVCLANGHRVERKP